MQSILKYLNGLAIDVALGAVVFSNAFAFYFKKTLPFQLSLLLFCSVWIIYTVDHLLDTRPPKLAATTFRHGIHKLLRRQLSVLVFILVLISFGTLFFVEEAIIWVGGMFTMIISLYLYLNYKFDIYAKELIVALGYTFGVMLGLLVSIDFQISTPILVLGFEIFLIAILNLLVFAFIEYNQDTIAGFRSVATSYGRIVTKRLIFLIPILFITLHIALAFYGIFYLFDPLQLILILMVVSLLIIFHCRERLMANDYYRTLGDGVFLLPALIFIL